MEPEVRYCLYARKSTEQDERQALSIDSQIKEMLELAARDNLSVVEIRKESHSAKASGARPVFNSIVEDTRSGKFNGILTWAADRLSRNAGDLGSLVDMMDEKLLHEIRTTSQRFTNNPNEKFLLMILCSQAKLENDNKSLNVKRGLKTRVEMGLWPGIAPTGYLNTRNVDQKCHLLVDPHRAPMIRKIFEKVAYENYSGRRVYLWLKDEEKFTTKNNKFLSVANIYILLRNTFYYGHFEYPIGTGRWYVGKHTPLITKELYDKAQEQLNKLNIQKSQSKEFAFTKLILCGLCQSSITAQEKYKKLKDGTTTKYIYYGCCKSKDLNCKSGFIREEELIDKLLTIINQMDINELGMRYQLEEEFERHKKFQTSVLGISEKEDAKIKDVEIRTYAKYVLKEGNLMEKRQLLSNLKSRLNLVNKEIKLK